MAGMTLDEANAFLMENDPLFAVTEAEVRGVRYKVFANAPQDLRELLIHGATVFEQEHFIVYEGERLTYDDYLDRISRTAGLLRERFGVRPGDRVAIAMRNYPEFLTLFMGVVAAGATAVLVNAWWTTEELDYGFADSGARLVFADGPRAARIRPFAAERGVTIVGVRDAEEPLTLDALLAETPKADWPEVPIHPDDDYAVMYSSGSTGHPKGVALTHRGAVTAVWSWLMALKAASLMAPADAPSPAPRPPAQLCATPLFHVTATGPVFLLSHAIGSKIVMMGKWDGERALRLINEEGITRFVGVPTMCADLREAALRTGIGAPTLEALSAGGAKRPAPQVAEQAAAFPNAAIASGWGMTETNALGLGIAGPDYEARPDHVGRPYGAVQEFRIVDEKGEEVPRGVLGELTVKSAANMRCYLNKPEETAAALRDGWLFTGDLATMDEEGYVAILDRKKAIIIRGGENISGLEVEGAIHAHGAVLEAAVFPAPDARLGEIVGAAIAKRPGAALTAAELRAFLAPRLAAFKTPERVWWVDGPLPRGATDKIDRRAIARDCLAGRLGVEATE